MTRDREFERARMRGNALTRWAFIACLLGALLGNNGSPLRAAESPAKKANFQDDVVPIFRARCASCHNPDKASADLDVMSYTQLLAGGASGEVIVAGDADSSRLFLLVTHAEEPKMPPKTGKIPDEEIQVIRQWIEGGILENAGSKAKIPNKPKVDLSLASAPTGKPDGPPPMPGDLLLENTLKTSRASAVTAIAASPWAPVIALAGQKQVLLYHGDTLELLGVLPFPEGSIHVLKFSRNGSLLLAGGGQGGKSGRVVVWSLADGKRVVEVGDDELDAVLAADISADQSQIALGGPGKLVKIYSTETGELLHSIKKHTDWIYTIEYSPDGVLLASGDRSGGLEVWEAHSGLEFYNLRGHSAAVTDVSWRGDSNVLASASEDASIRLWEMENGTQVKTWNAHGGGVQSVRYAHDGRLVSAGRDNLVKSWDGNGAQQLAFEPFSDLATRATFGHDGGRVFAGDWNGEVRVWNGADGARVGNLSTNPPTIAERIESAKVALPPFEASAKTTADALVAAETVAKTAAEELAALEKQVTDTAAAAKESAEKLAAEKRAGEKLKADFAAAQSELANQQRNAKKAAENAASAKKPADETAIAAKNATEAFSVRESIAKMLAEVAGNAKEASEKSPEDKNLAEAATGAQSAAEKAAAATAEAKKVLDQATEAAKGPADTYAKAKEEADKAAIALAVAEKAVVDLATANKSSEENLITLEKQTGDAATAAAAAVEAAKAKEPAVKTAMDAAAMAKQAAEQAANALAAGKAELQKWIVAEVKARRHQAEQLLAARQAAKEAMDAALDEARREAEQSAMELAQAQQFLGDAPALLKTAEENQTKAKQLVDRVNAELEASKQAIAEKETLTTPLAELAAKVENSAAKAPENKTLEQAAAKAKESLAMLNGDLEAAKMVLAAQNDALGKANGALKDAVAAVEKLNNDSLAATQKVERLTKVVPQVTAKAEAAKTDAENAAGELAKAQTEIEKIQAELSALAPKT